MKILESSYFIGLFAYWGTYPSVSKTPLWLMELLTAIIFWNACCPSIRNWIGSFGQNCSGKKMRSDRMCEPAPGVAEHSFPTVAGSSTACTANHFMSGSVTGTNSAAIIIESRWKARDLLPVNASESLAQQGFPWPVQTGDEEWIVFIKNRVLTGNKTAVAVIQKKVYNFLSL